MKSYKNFIKEASKCPLGMKWDKKSKTCVPIITKTKYGPRWWGIGTYHHRTTNGNGNGNGSTNGNGSGNGNNGGNGHSAGNGSGGGNGGGSSGNGG